MSLFGVWDELSLGTNCRLGQIVAFWNLGRIVAFWNLGRIVAWDELSLFGIWDELSLFGIWDELSLGTICRFTLKKCSEETKHV